MRDGGEANGAAPPPSALELPADTVDGQARSEALSSAPPLLREPPAIVTYRSAGHVLIIGPEPAACSAAESLVETLRCTVLAVWSPDVAGSSGSDSAPIAGKGGNGRLQIVRGRLDSLQGYLGHFTATVTVHERRLHLPGALSGEGEHFDLVLDLGRTPTLRCDLPPPGYYAPHGDARALDRALAELPDMVGEFDKPRYFQYNADLCVHGSSGKVGCTRCLDSCASLAITSLGDAVSVDPHLCQGAGSCSTVCPSGAMTYTYPRVTDLLVRIKGALVAYRNAGGTHPSLLIHDAEYGKAQVQRLAGTMPECILPIEVEEIGSVGMDAWLAALAYGADAVVLLASPAVPRAAVQASLQQLEYAVPLLRGVGNGALRLQLADSPTDAELGALLATLPDCPATTPARFAPQGDKRTTMRLALEHLEADAPDGSESIPLPSGAPFGAIEVRREVCTLCLACASICPAGALEGGGDRPQLRFIEWNCVQCGLCAAACPEDAIRLMPRFLCDAQGRHERRTLHEEEPFRCIVCGTPFATQSVVARMTEKLRGHWMFQGPEAIRRLQMCGDCRIKDMLGGEEGPGDVRGKT